ncbi:MAG: hypothetical protein EA428_00835 [Spirochaetaceae bacterium]|nr:MAG: hypothetical protein EA428_00835 [Spirochaetaceae bacterium]
MRYFFTKLGPGNSLASALLDECRLGEPTLVGFFRDLRMPELRDHPHDQRPRFSAQALELYRWAAGELEGYAVTSAERNVWILEAAGPMYEMEREEFEAVVGPTPHQDDVPKLVPVRVVYRRAVTHVPAVLQQITANRRLSSSTFKLIPEDFGLEMAIDYVLFMAGILTRFPRCSPETRNLEHLFLCLGDNELLALIVRLFEEQGLYVPPPTGGFVKNIDLFVRNYQTPARDIAGIYVPGRWLFRYGAIAVELKKTGPETYTEPPTEVDYRIQLNGEPGPGVMTRDWIVETLRHCPNTRQWLEALVRWVPFGARLLRELEP